MPDFEDPSKSDDENQEFQDQDQENIEITKSTGGNAGQDESKTDENDEKQDDLDKEDMLEDQNDKENRRKDIFSSHQNYHKYHHNEFENVCIFSSRAF